MDRTAWRCADQFLLLVLNVLTLVGGVQGGWDSSSGWGVKGTRDYGENGPKASFNTKKGKVGVSAKAGVKACAGTKW